MNRNDNGPSQLCIYHTYYNLLKIICLLFYFIIMLYCKDVYLLLLVLKFRKFDYDVQTVVT